MKRWLILAVMALLSFAASANPNVTSAATAATVTHCLFYVDGATTPTVVPISAGQICTLDVGTIATGAHTVKARARTVDPIWGTQDSTADSAPLTFTRPAPPPVITGLTLTP